MTDEERQELINSLYVASDDRWSDAGRLCKDAADEIERLAADVEHWKMIANRAYIDPKPLAQSDAEPTWLIEAADIPEQVWQSLPPRPASAGLIEAAEFAERTAWSWGPEAGATLREFAKILRANAADRSKKP